MQHKKLDKSLLYTSIFIKYTAHAIAIKQKEGKETFM